MIPIIRSPLAERVNMTRHTPVKPVELQSVDAVKCGKFGLVKSMIDYYISIGSLVRS
jgi:hypothetical protein